MWKYTFSASYADNTALGKLSEETTIKKPFFWYRETKSFFCGY